MSCGGGCHSDNEDGTFGGILPFNVNSFKYPTSDRWDGNYTDTNEADLAAFIEDEMPPSGGCDATCAADTAAYLWSLRGQEQQQGPLSCTSEDPVFYGKRALRLLTSFEYHNSLQALFSRTLPDDFSTQNRAQNDKYVANLPNNIKEPVSEGRLATYNRNAEELAAWAIDDGALPFDCSDTQSAACATVFINDFAYPAFRRPLDADEREQFTGIITGSSSGLQWAVRAVLMSPQFLYRSELGVKVSDALADPSFNVGDGDQGGSGGNADGYEAGSGGTTVNGANFSSITVGENNDDGTHNLWGAGSIAHSFSFSDPAILIINAKGNDYDNRWAQMTVTVGGQTLAMDMVEHYELKQYKYLIPNRSGSQQVQIAFSNMDEGREPYGEPGNDKNLYIGDVTVAPAVMAGNDAQPQPVEAGDPLTLADPDAYVLTPHEYAAALSYMYTASSPDDELLQAAANGDLSDPAEVEYHIDRMLDSDLGREQVGRFAGMWFRTDAVTAVNRQDPNFTQDIKDSMAQEVREIYKEVFYNESVPFEEIYAGSFTMLDRTLSEYYGMPGGGSGHMRFAKVDTAGTPRGGVIASGAFMASNAHMDRTSPILRAVHFRQDVLCQAIPLPPAFGDSDARDAAVERAKQLETTGELTTTEFYDIQTNVPGTACAACHKSIINPLFAMDDFDNVGLPRTTVGGEFVQKGLGENGKANVPIDMVNAGGNLFAASLAGVVSAEQADADNATGNGISFKGAKNLGQVIVENDLPGVDACLVQKSFRFAAGYPLNAAYLEPSAGETLTAQEKDHFLCVSEQLESELNQNNSSPRAMLKALGMSDVIRFRR